MAEMLIYTGDLKSRVEPSKVVNARTYTLFNDEAVGSPNYINTLNLEPRVPFTVTASPPGWTADTDNSVFVLWYSTAQSFDIPPGGTLTGFIITSQTDVVNPTPVTITSWNHTSNAAGPVLVGAVKTLAPTAASVSVEGRVIRPDGRGLARAFVTMTNATGEARSAMTNPFGYYHFKDLMAGETYIFDVRSKGYVFAPQVVFLTEDRQDLNFTAAADKRVRIF